MKRFEIVGVERAGQEFFQIRDIERDELFETLFPHAPTKQVEALNAQVADGSVDTLARRARDLIHELEVVVLHLPFEDGELLLDQASDFFDKLFVSLGASENLGEPEDAASKSPTQGGIGRSTREFA